MIFEFQVGWGFTTGYDPWLGDSQVSHNQNQLFSSSGEKSPKFDVKPICSNNHIKICFLISSNEV